MLQFVGGMSGISGRRSVPGRGTGPSTRMPTYGSRSRRGAEARFWPLARKWWIVPLLRLTTVRFRDDPGIDRRIVERSLQLEREGWMVRTAGPRNYLSWRNAAALDRGARIVVLPNGDFLFNHEERNVAILRDLVIAEFRVRQYPMWLGRDRVVRLLTMLGKALYPHHPVSERHIERLLCRIDAKINAGPDPARAARPHLSPCRDRRSC